MKTKKKPKKETIRMYVNADSILLYFVKNGMEIGFLRICDNDNDEIHECAMPLPDSWHKKHSTFIGEL